MCIRNSVITVIFRVVFLILCGVGIVLKLVYTGFGINTVLGDFALISNVLALIYFAYLIIARPGRERGLLRGAVTIYMITTFIVYYCVYFGAPAVSTAYLSHLTLVGYLLYFIAPLMAFIDYLLFCEKGDFTPNSPVIWALLPVLFNIAVFVVNMIGIYAVRMPYFNLLGMNIIITLLVFLGLSYLLFLLDNLMAGRRR